MGDGCIKGLLVMHLIALRRAGVGLLLHEGVSPRGYLPYGLQLAPRCGLLWEAPPAHQIWRPSGHIQDFLQQWLDFSLPP